MTNEEMINSPLDEAEFCIVDVETTGLSPRANNIIEIGLVKISNLKIVDTFHTLINPGRDIPYFISNLTGITNDDVYDAPFFEDIVEDICKFISEGIITAHNLSFDKSFLRREFIYCGREELSNTTLCTLRLARRLYPMLRSKSLGSISSHLRIFNSGEHRALSDAESTAKILLKMIKNVQNNFSVNLVSDLLNLQYVPQAATKSPAIKKKLSEDLMGIPDAPGTYYFLNSKNEIIYIGKAKSLKNRVKSYFSPTAPKKAKRIIKYASRLKIEITNSELTALLTEAESIKLVNPKHNSMLKKYGSKYFLRITSSEAFPQIQITNHFDFDGNDYFGLFISRNKAVLVHEMLTKTFAIRECAEKEFLKKKGCFLADIERCTAPCVNEDKALYQNELEKVYEFLYGKNQYALNRLINKMKEYSDKQKFEKAAEVKILIDMILSQTHKSSLLSEPVNKANVLFEINEGFQRDYILMIGGKIFVKKYALKVKDNFETALDDYYEGTINISSIPDDEDMEKMKITLNWLIKNRNKVRVFYLKDHNNKHELYSRLTSYGRKDDLPLESVFDISNFINQNSEAFSDV
jgi:DNA polymerase III subunit epsilon